MKTNEVFEIIMRHTPITGNEYCSTAEFERAMEAAAEEICGHLTTSTPDPATTVASAVSDQTNPANGESKPGR